jgi:hypothetical protein
VKGENPVVPPDGPSILELLPVMVMAPPPLLLLLLPVMLVASAVLLVR